MLHPPAISRTELVDRTHVLPFVRATSRDYHTPEIRRRKKLSHTPIRDERNPLGNAMHYQTHLGEALKGPEKSHLGWGPICVLVPLRVLPFRAPGVSNTVSRKESFHVQSSVLHLPDWSALWRCHLPGGCRCGALGEAMYTPWYLLPLIALLISSVLCPVLYYVASRSAGKRRRSTHDRRTTSSASYYLTVVDRHGRTRCRFPGTKRGQYLLRQWMVWHAALGDSVVTVPCERTHPDRRGRPIRTTVHPSMQEAEHIHAQYLSSLQDMH